MTRYSRDQFLRHSHLTGILELICQELELTAAQHALAEQRYNTIGRWLAESENLVLRTASIYSQGSIKHRTTVRPRGQTEFDVDLVCHMTGIGSQTPPARVKALVGQRLRQHGTFKGLLEEKPRCWRLTYADDFHLDITPSIRNLACPNGGELVPDKKLQQWKASNPRGYSRWFDERAALSPSIRLAAHDMAKVRADVEALPGPSRFKGVLRRAVQLCKRHRDVLFAEIPELAPISILITTLAARSYAACVGTRRFETDLDVLREIILGMPAQIETAGQGQSRQYFVWNETTTGENFAEKWNSDSRLADSFYRWHGRALTDLGGAGSNLGLDSIRRNLGAALGKPLVGKAMSRLNDDISEARKVGSLAVASGLGLTVNRTSAASTVRPNTFYGD